MWIATNRGFLSAVTADPARLPKAERKLPSLGTVLCIRARNAAHLRDLFPGYRVYEWKGRDYPARVFISAESFALFVADQARAIDYSNFKNSVADDPLHDAYMGIWTVMHGYQHGRYDRKPYDPAAAHGYGSFRGQGRFDNLIAVGSLDGELDDDYPCDEPGCTDDMPCLDCLTTAINRSDPRFNSVQACYVEDDERTDEELLDLADQKHQAQMADLEPDPDFLRDLKRDDAMDRERYGDFDGDDDSEAQSHLRVPPR